MKTIQPIGLCEIFLVCLALPWIASISLKTLMPALDIPADYN